MRFCSKRKKIFIILHAQIFQISLDGANIDVRYQRHSQDQSKPKKTISKTCAFVLKRKKTDIYTLNMKFSNPNLFFE